MKNRLFPFKTTRFSLWVLISANVFAIVLLFILWTNHVADGLFRKALSQKAFIVHTSSEGAVVKDGKNSLMSGEVFTSLVENLKLSNKILNHNRGKQEVILCNFEKGGGVNASVIVGKKLDAKVDAELENLVVESLAYNNPTSSFTGSLFSTLQISVFEPIENCNLVVVVRVAFFYAYRWFFVVSLLFVFLSILVYFVADKLLCQSVSTKLLTAQNEELERSLNLLRIEKQQLEANDYKLRMFIDNTNDMELFLNAAGQFEYVSPSIKQVLGYEPELFIENKISLLNVVAPEFSDAAIEVFGRVSKGERVENHECKMIHKDGSFKYMSVTSTPIYDVNKNLMGVRCSIRDVTEKKKAFERLIVSESQFRKLSFEQELILDNLPALAYFKDTKNCYLQANKYVADALDMSKEELVGKSFEELYPEKLASKYYADDLEVIKSKTPKYGTEEAWITKNDLRWLSTSRIPILDETNTVSGIICLSLDITAQKEKELMLKTRDQHMKLITSNIPAIIFHVDYTLKFIFTNLEFEIFTSKMSSDVIGKSIKNVLDDYAYTSIFPFIQRALAGEVVSFENDMINSKGQKRVFKTTFVPELNKENVVQGFFALAIDVTVEAEYKRQLIVAKEKAEESDRLKTAFLANISHEIRTPMNGIMGFAQLLVKSTVEEKRTAYIKTIDESCQKLLSIINDILDVSKLETGQVTVSAEPANINKIISEVLTRSKVFVEASGIPITQVNGLEDGSDKINIDKQKLTKILDHLVDNAKKFTSKGSIEVGYVVRNTYYEFYVKDSGIGIEKHMHDSIFDRFLQAERGMSRTYGGTGLGLSICKGYVNLMGGKIWLESEVGEGTTFFFSVPTVKLVSEPVYVIKEDVHSTDVKTVLVAEDEEVNMLYVREILQAKNIVILQAVNGLSAVEIFKNNPGVSLVLMDIKMPFMDGYAATKEIKLINPNVPIIAQTAYALSDDAEKVKSQGFDDYVAKPMTEDKLMKVVSKYINL